MPDMPTTAAWIVSLASNDNPRAERNVYFAESAYDIMAFQHHKALATEFLQYSFKVQKFILPKVRIFLQTTA